MTPKTSKNPKLKNFKKSCKEASNQKGQKTNYNQNWKILRMPFSEISKTQKLLQKHPKTKNSNKFKKSCKEASNKKKVRKQTIIRIEKY